MNPDGGDIFSGRQYSPETIKIMNICKNSLRKYAQHAAKYLELDHPESRQMCVIKNVTFSMTHIVQCMTQGGQVQYIWLHVEYIFLKILTFSDTRIYIQLIIRIL